MAQFFALFEGDGPEKLIEIFASEVTVVHDVGGAVNLREMPDGRGREFSTLNYSASLFFRPIVSTYSLLFTIDIHYTIR